MSIEVCRYCDKPVLDDHAITHGYWNGFPFACHFRCKAEGVKREAYDCQLIDADCNDCGHFKRGSLIAKGVWFGQCLKFNRETRAYPNKWTGRTCFEHRRKQFYETTQP